MTDFEFHFFMFGTTIIAAAAAYYVKHPQSRTWSMIAILIISTIVAVPMWAAKIMVWLQ